MADSDRRELTTSLGVALRANNTALQSTIWTALPGFIVEFDAAKMTCKVQPTIQAQVLTAQGVTKNVTLPVLVDCPVVFPSGGGFTLTFPLAAKDECLVVFSSRCIDSWWHSSGVQVQTELRMHDLSDGFVIPGPRSIPKVLPGGSDPTRVQLRNDLGNTHVSITPAGEVQVTASALVTVTAPDVVINGNVTINGMLNVTELVTALDFKTISELFTYMTHKHDVLHGTDLGPPVAYP